MADYEAGDMMIRSVYMIHAATTNEDPQGRIRLSTDIRYQLVTDAIDQRRSQHWSADDQLKAHPASIAQPCRIGMETHIVVKLSSMAAKTGQDSTKKALAKSSRKAKGDANQSETLPAVDTPIIPIYSTMRRERP